jgi:DNA-binding transcriptional LysR family regulator
MSNIQWTERIGRRLKLRDLHVLFAVVEAGSMAKASRRLAVSQPVVSQAIADLEHALGVRLVDRHRRGIEPTIYGRSLLNHGLAAFDSLRQGVKELEYLADPTVGELRVGCPEWVMAGLLPVIIDKLARRYPRLVFHVQQTVPATSEFRELRQRSLDLVLGRIAAPFEAHDLQAEVLYQEKLSVVAGVRSPWARRKRIELAELVDQRWILTPQNDLPGSLVRDAFRSSGLRPPEPIVSAFSVHLRNRLLATGRYLSVVPDSLLVHAGHRMSFKILPVKLPILPRPVAIVTLKNRMLSPVVRLFIDCARDLTKALAQHSLAKAAEAPLQGRPR